ncbi:MAG: ferredoxin [Patescibacteria group bacterium]|jgi:ferredoxin
MKIHLDRDKCISAGTCVAIAPEVFELDQEGKVKMKNENGADDQTILDAAKSCPVLAIELYEDNGRRIFPE